eukprot:CAMPEP_0179479092 /NCGR_PEP_ID=MMETSP0799-20121207/57407_1 /TAXON_ID=46947 /ORGANISM="Geminigera cryophila, Strain CCMP2564" /LENGTH=120 /DNA_ID=CAMNT_0021290527 /DNA_START=356 /DNA_END=718 /DNA_ORIENTATION=-
MNGASAKSAKLAPNGHVGAVFAFSYGALRQRAPFDTQLPIFYRNVFLISRIVLNCTGMLAAAMVSGSWSGIGEIHDCLPVSNSTALGPKNCQAETPQEPPQLHGVDEIHDALVFFPGSFD